MYIFKGFYIGALRESSQSTLFYKVFWSKIGGGQNFFYLDWEFFTPRESIIVLTGWTLSYIKLKVNLHTKNIAVLSLFPW